MPKARAWSLPPLMKHCVRLAQTICMLTLRLKCVWRKLMSTTKVMRPKKSRCKIPLLAVYLSGISCLKVWRLMSVTKRWPRKISLSWSTLATVKLAWKKVSCSLTNWCTLALHKQPYLACLLVSMTWSFHRWKNKSSKPLKQKFAKLKINSSKVLWPRVSVIIKSSISGRVPMIKSLKRWWITWQLIKLSMPKVKKTSRNRSTLSLSCRILVLVVVRHRFVSLLVCVVWWQSRMARSLRRRLKPTSAKVWPYCSTLFQRTVRVKVLPIPL